MKNHCKIETIIIEREVNQTMWLPDLGLWWC